MKTIAFFQKDLKNDGISNALRNLLKSGFLDEFEIDVYLIDESNTSGFGENVHFYYLPELPYVNRVIPFGILNFNMRKQVTKEYDYAVDYNGYQNSCALYCVNTKAKKHICWVHNDFYEQKERWQNRVYFAIQRGKWKKFDEFVAVSEGAKLGFQQLTGTKDYNIKVLPNAINWGEIKRKSSIAGDRIEVDSEYTNLLIVGRLVHQKGIDSFLRIFAKSKREDLRLYIMGEGEKGKEYKHLAKTLGVEDRVIFMGNRRNPYAVMKQVDALVLNSRYEGQGLVLVEARYLGVPIIYPKALDKYTFLLRGVENVRLAVEAVGKKEDKGIDYAFQTEYIETQRKLISNIFD